MNKIREYIYGKIMEIRENKRLTAEQRVVAYALLIDILKFVKGDVDEDRSH